MWAVLFSLLGYGIWAAMVFIVVGAMFSVIVIPWVPEWHYLMDIREYDLFNSKVLSCLFLVCSMVMLTMFFSIKALNLTTKLITKAFNVVNNSIDALDNLIQKISKFILDTFCKKID